MKKILSVFTITAVMVACNSDKDKVAAENARLKAYKDSVELVADTAGLAEYQMWKAQNELSDQKDYNQSLVATEPATRTVVKHVPAKTSRSSASGSRSRNSGNGSMSSESGHTAKAPAKKGWSKSAKGAVIGGATGAAAGAVINKKNRVAGGVIGGAVGAGVGYGIGRHLDKKDGRY